MSAVTGNTFGDVLKGPASAYENSAAANPAMAVAGTVGSTGIVSGTGSLIQTGIQTAGKIAGTSGTGKFSAAQKQYATRLAGDSGLNVNVILAWMQQEQPPGSASAPNGTNNWLNIGATDNGFFGGSNPAWADPTTAADETYHWMLGNGIQDYGPPSAGIIGILSTAGQSAEAQIAAIQHSGWASGGESSLGEIYSELTS